MQPYQEYQRQFQNFQPNMYQITNEDLVSLYPYLDQVKKLLRKPQYSRQWKIQKDLYQQQIRKSSEQQQPPVIEANVERQLGTLNNDEQRILVQEKNQINQQNNFQSDQDDQQLAQQNFVPFELAQQNVQPSDDFQHNRLIQNTHPKKVKKMTLHLGIEFDELVFDEGDLIQMIVRNKFYNLDSYLTEEQQLEFNQIFNDVDKLDGRNIGTIIGMAMLGLLGFIALGFTVIGVVVGGALVIIYYVIKIKQGVIIGRYAGKRIKRTLKQKNNKLVELDIFEIRSRCYIKWVKMQQIKYKWNLNLLRFIVEKLISEIKPALHYKYFEKPLQKQLKHLLGKVVTLLKQPPIVNALILSFKLCKEYWKILLEMTKRESNPGMYRQSSIPMQQKMDVEVALLRTLDNVLKPLNTILKDANIKKGQLSKLQKDIEKFLIKPSILQLTHVYPDPQMSLEFIKLFAGKMKGAVKVENLQETVERQNFRDIENIGLLIGNERQSVLTNDSLIRVKNSQEKINNQIQLEKVEEVYEEEDLFQNDQDFIEQKQQIQPQKVVYVNQVQDNKENIPNLVLNHQTSQQSKEQQVQYRNSAQILEVQSEMPSVKFLLTEHPNKVDMQQLNGKPGDIELQSNNSQKRGSNNIAPSIQPFDLEQLDPELKSVYMNEIQQSIQLMQIQVPPQHPIQSEPIYSEFIQSRFKLFTEILNEPNSTWDKVCAKEDIYIYKMLKQGKGCVYVKGDAIIYGVPKDIVIKCMCVPEYRSSWDKILHGFSIVDKIDENTDIIYFYTPPPIPIVSVREFLQQRILRKNYPKADQDTILFYSVESDKKPIKKGWIRVQTDVAGYVFEDIPQGTRIQFVSNNDVKGSVPKALVNYASSKAPFQWFGGLRKASLQIFQAKGDLSKLKLK